MPIAADVAGKPLLLGDLRVKYLMLDAGAYSIIDRTNRVVDSGHYLVNEAAHPATMDIVGRDGPNAGRSMLAIYQLDGDSLTVCYDLESGERPPSMQPKQDQLLLSITYARALAALS